MFRQLPNYLSTQSDSFDPALVPPTELFDRHPIDVAAYVEAVLEQETSAVVVLELTWQQRGAGTSRSPQ